MTNSSDSSQHSGSDTLEIRELPMRMNDPPVGLPDIPGGWTQRAWQIEGRSFQLVLPASPDAFLEDAEVHAAFDRDEYMPYWAYVWPASLKMVASILRHAWPENGEVLELGCGIGLAGMAGLACGLNVTFSDYEPKSVDLCLFNAERSGYAKAKGLVIDWRQPPDVEFPIIWGCELLYEDRNHEPLIELVRRMLSPNGTAWFVDGGRAKAERFVKLVEKAGFLCRLFDENMNPLAAPRVGRYQLIELKKS